MRVLPHRCSSQLATMLWLAALASPLGAPVWSWPLSMLLQRTLCRAVPLDVISTDMVCAPGWLDPAANYVMFWMTVWMMSFVVIVPGVLWTLAAVWLLRRSLGSLAQHRAKGT
jgi:hypothetical protein